MKFVYLLFFFFEEIFVNVFLVECLLKGSKEGRKGRDVEMWKVNVNF